MPLPAPDDPPEARHRRERLVGEVIARVVSDARVLAAMAAVPRHWFVDADQQAHAYDDTPLTIGFDATISQPSLVGIMSEALELSGTERVLEIGTGSGYQAAVLARLARHIDTIEVVPELAARARQALAAVGAGNVTVHVGDGWAGLPRNAPFDRIVVTAAPDVLPAALIDQLVDGGSLLVPVGAQRQDQRLERWRKHASRRTKEDLGAVRFVPMVHVV